MRRSGPLDVLSERGFGSLLMSLALLDLGVFMRIAAQSWVVFELTGSQLWVGAAAGVRAIPTLLIALFGGVLSDRMARQTVIFWSHIFLAALVALTAVLVATEEIEAWHFLLLAVGAGVGTAFEAPAFFALIPDIVRPSRLPRANGMVALVSSTGEMAGPAIVGFAIASSGADTAFWIVTGAYLLGAVLILRVPKMEREPTDRSGSVLSEVREGIAYVGRTQPLPWLIVLVMANNLLGVAIFPLMPVYAEDVLDVGPRGFGVMGGVFGAGLLVGALLVSYFGIYRRRMMVILVTATVWDAGMVSFGFSRSYPLSLAILFTMGLAGIPWVNAVLTLFQTAAVEKMRGRVMAIYVIAMDMFPLGWLYGGAVAAWLGNEEALIISAIGGTPLVLLAMAFSPKLRRA